MPNYLRSCTDIFCLFILVLIIGGFVGLMIYAFIAGDALSVIAIYNSNQVRCNTDPNFPCTFIAIQSATSLPPGSSGFASPVAPPPLQLASHALPMGSAVLLQRWVQQWAPSLLNTPQLQYNPTVCPLRSAM